MLVTTATKKEFSGWWENFISEFVPQSWIDYIEPPQPTKMQQSNVYDTSAQLDGFGDSGTPTLSTSMILYGIGAAALLYWVFKR